MSPGDIIRTALKSRGWTQREFAKLLDSGETTVSAHITGRVRLSPALAARMEAVLDDPGFTERVLVAQALADAAEALAALQVTS